MIGQLPSRNADHVAAPIVTNSEKTAIALVAACTIGTVPIGASASATVAVPNTPSATTAVVAPRPAGRTPNRSNDAPTAATPATMSPYEYTWCHGTSSASNSERNDLNRSCPVGTTKSKIHDE